MSGRYFIDHGMWHDRKTGRHLEDIVGEVKPSERLAKLLVAVADYEQTPEEARAELEADGVDVNAFLARVHDDERAWLLARAERAERECGEALAQHAALLDHMRRNDYGLPPSGAANAILVALADARERLKTVVKNDPFNECWKDLHVARGRASKLETRNTELTTALREIAKGACIPNAADECNWTCVEIAQAALKTLEEAMAR